MISGGLYGKILNLEEDKTIQYSMIINMLDSIPHYGVHLSQNITGVREEESIPEVSCNKDSVCGLIDALYQNCVNMLHFKDVVEDYILEE